MQYINLNHNSDSDSLELKDALKYISRNSLLHATLISSNTIEFYDESSIKQFTYQIPQPYSNGADPTGDLNTEEYLKFQKTVTDELDKCLGRSKTFLEDHVVITTDLESFEVHFIPTCSLLCG